ncbi:MAG: single-stranded-DNA-specific exonuclease RecJ, partial [Deltaproteobacteria bacterium]|nr:single-stranded-DNA-specific exonuclease RecJ [Deltaproteobacteria bacterium]
MAINLEKPFKYGEFLAGRSFRTPEEVQAFLDTSLKKLPQPTSMPGMDKAVKLLLEARRAGALVAVSGDYDVDGLTATALLKRVLGDLGFNVLTRIPHRLEEGYGLSLAAVREIHEAGATYLITVDSGVSDIEAVLEATLLGLKVIVTDHHHLPPALPAAAAIINPHLGGGWESSLLAGVGVAFMLAGAVRSAIGEEGKDVNLVEQLALVALGTIADLAPLTGPNRTMVYHGLKFLLACEWPGLKALKQSLKLEGMQRVTVRDVGFKIAPRLNAAGRLGSAKPALEILVTDSHEEASRLVEELESLNKIRYDTQAELVVEALELLNHQCQADAMTVILAKDGWPKGLLGLGASRVAERTGKPTILFSIEEGQAIGSGRTAGTFDIFEALSKIRDLCLSMGGHSQAAGITLAKERLEEFKTAFERAAKEQGDDWAKSAL